MNNEWNCHVKEEAKKKWDYGNFFVSLSQLIKPID